MASLNEKLTEAPAPAPEGLQLFSKISTAAADLNASRERILAVVRDQVRVPLEEIIRCAEDIAHPSSSGPSPDSVDRIRDAAHHLLLILDTTSASPSALAGGTGRLSSASTVKQVQSSSWSRPSLLIVDDNDELSGEVLTLLLSSHGFDVSSASTGEEALATLKSGGIDVVLLDFNLPGMNGLDVLKRMKSDPVQRDIPVIMLSGEEQSDRIVAAIEQGAEDFLPKPFNPTLLRARINSSLEKKRFRDHDRAMMQDLQLEQAKAEALLLNVLPKPVADRLKQGQTSIVDSFPAVTVLFADLVEFTSESARSSPADIVRWLNMIFSEFDRLAELYGLEKIKTIGDSYMAVGGLPVPRTDHAEACAHMALEMQSSIARLNRENDTKWRLRIGMHSGPVIAGIIGTKKFIYDLWGDTVNTASRMESHGTPEKIQVSEATYFLLKGKFNLARRGLIEVKGKGSMTTYLLQPR